MSPSQATIMVSNNVKGMSAELRERLTIFPATMLDNEELCIKTEKHKKRSHAQAYAKSKMYKRKDIVRVLKIRLDSRRGAQGRRDFRKFHA